MDNHLFRAQVATALLLLLATPTIIAAADPPLLSQTPGRASVGQSQTTAPIHGRGQKILETDLYELYWRASESGVCGWAGISAEVVQIFKVGPEFAIKDNIDYEERFEQEILPTLKAQCKLLSDVKIDHYIKGVKVDEWLQEYREDESMSDDERPLSTTNVTLNARGAPVMYRMNGYGSLVELRTKRAALYPNVAKGELSAERRKLNMAADEEMRKWRKREEESALRQRAIEEEAEQKLAATNATADANYHSLESRTNTRGCSS
ncbi:MAG: hypothetical protein IT389_08775 [Nitrospira sp.]|nr:hypothetical protein [Nitrospira sp.]